MLAFQREAGLGGVIEALALQANDREVFAVMLHVTAHAVRLACRCLVSARVKAAVAVDPLAYLDVAFQAFERSPSRGEIVASGTLRYALPLLMGFRQRSRRYLSRSQDPTRR